MSGGDKGKHMDATFWIGISIGAILSLLASIAANLAHSRITGFFEKRKLVSHEERKQRALTQHKIVVEIHSGKRDKYLYFLHQSTGLIVASILVISSLCSAIVLLAIFPTPPPPDAFGHTDLLRLLMALLLVFLTAFGAIVLSIITNNLKTVQSALEDYPRYIADFEGRWGLPEG